MPLQEVHGCELFRVIDCNAIPQLFWLRNAQGALTARGKELYTQPELTVEVPAWQIGMGKLVQFKLETTWVYTETLSEPQIGEIFRRHDDGTNTATNLGLIAVKSALLDMIRAAKIFWLKSRT